MISCDPKPKKSIKDRVDFLSENIRGKKNGIIWDFFPNVGPCPLCFWMRNDESGKH